MIIFHVKNEAKKKFIFIVIFFNLKIKFFQILDFE